LGGLVAEKIGVMWTVGVHVATCLTSAGLLGTMRLTEHAVTAPTTSATREFRVAVRYLWEHPTAAPLFILSGVFMFVLGILMVVFIGYAKETLRLGATEIGYLIGAGGGGAAVGIGLLGHGKPWTKSRWLPMGLLLLAAGALFGLSAVTNVWLAAPVVFALGAASATILIAIDSRLQAQVEEVRRGPVFAARGMLTSATMIVAFWLQFGTEIFRRTPPATVLLWLAVGAVAGAGAMLLVGQRRDGADNAGGHPG
jgi:hypothetical protein